MQTIKPAKNQLFCKPAKAEKQTASGFFLTEKSLEKPKLAEVINTGANVTQFKPTENIIYKSYSTTEIKLDNEDYFLVAEDDVLGVVIETNENSRNPL